MAEEATEDEEKTEEPTSRRLEQARERGEMPRSPDFGGAMIVIALCLFLAYFGQILVTDLSSLLVRSLSFNRSKIDDVNDLPGAIGYSLIEGFWSIKWIFLVSVAVAFLASGLNGGFNFSAAAAAPKLSKLNLLSGLKRMFGLQAWAGVLRNLLKFSVIGAVLFFVLWGRRAELVSISSYAFEPMLRAGVAIALSVFTLVSLAVAAIAIFDVPYQRWIYFRRMRMSKKEIRDEMKDIEGRPEIKQQIRRRQREISRSRMLDKVKDADVVIVNPAEFAIAISYDEQKSGVPVVLASGRGDIAASIKERAKLASIPVVVAPPLARALYYTTNVDQPIPEGLYRAVAAVLAYVFRMSALTPDLRTPEFAAPTVPSEFLFDEDGTPIAGRKL